MEVDTKKEKERLQAEIEQLSQQLMQINQQMAGFQQQQQNVTAMILRKSGALEEFEKLKG